MTQGRAAVTAGQAPVGAVIKLPGDDRCADEDCRHERFMHEEDGCTHGEDDEFDYWPCGCEQFKEAD